MELLQLEYFCEVVKQGGITKAAQALHVSQPALSQTIRRLETELETPLFERSWRTIRLTPEGQRFYNHIQDVLIRLREAREDLTPSRLRGVIRIGSYMPLKILLPCIREFAKANPYVDFSFLSVYNHSAQPSEKLDVLLMYEHSDPLNLRRTMNIGMVDVVSVIPSDSPLTSQRIEGLADAAEEDFVSLLRGGQVEEVFAEYKKYGVIPRIRYTTNSRSFKQELLEEGLCTGISNLLLTEQFRATERYSIRSIRELKTLGVWLAWAPEHSLSPAAEAFQRHCSQWFHL